MTKPLIVCLWTKCSQMVFLQSRRLSNKGKVFNADCDSVNVTPWELLWISQSFTQLTWVSPYSADTIQWTWLFMNMIHWTCSKLKNTVTLRLAQKITTKRIKEKRSEWDIATWPHAHKEKITDWCEQTSIGGLKLILHCLHTLISYILDDGIILLLNAGCDFHEKLCRWLVCKPRSVTFQFNPC